MVDRPTAHTLVWCGLLAMTALPGLVAAGHPVVGRIGRIAEVVVAVLAASAIGGPYGSTLPYLLVPVVAAALYSGPIEAGFLVALAAVVGAGSGIVDGRLDTVSYVAPRIEWLVVTAVAAAVSWWLRGVLSKPPSPQPPYVEATRLLTQLRTVARQLPGGTLDPDSIAAHLLDEVRAVVPSDRAAVLGGGEAGRLAVLAQVGRDRVDWETSLDADTQIADAWASQQPHASDRSTSRSLAVRVADAAVSALVVPLVAGVRTVGLVVVEADRQNAYPPHLVAAVAAIAAPAALRLEAALLFDEVRSLATTEERQRLAREIHDGIAQELVMVGYGIDNALAQLPEGATVAAEELRALRSEVTRLITELRLSMFELRAEVDRHGGLATAIADFARTVGASAGLRVHLSLDESTARLPAAVETELLRIAQEAITNARKHAQAENLWVTCELDPPFARVEVSDDGQGMVGVPRPGRYGLAIMAERAGRIRGELEIRQRHPQGTTVAVVVGRSPGRG